MHVRHRCRSTAIGLGVFETPTETVIDCDIEPDVPVIVTPAAEAVRGALAEAVNVNVDPEVELPGVNVAVTPLGSPEAASVTGPVNEPMGVMPICVPDEVPGTTPKLAGMRTK